MHRSASFSPCRRYRYLLSRRWAEGDTLLWIMLNPSTADAERDDPTIRRCVGFSRAWGFGAMRVVNLFAWRATSPADLFAAPEPVGDANDLTILEEAANAGTVIGAWGAHRLAHGRAARVLRLLDRPVRYLGRTASGAPRHPLYAPRNAVLTSLRRVRCLKIATV